MTFPATNLRFGNGPVNLLTKGGYFHTALKQGGERTVHRTVQLHEFAGIGLQDRRHRTGPAEIGRPFLARSHEQAAFFLVPAAEIIAMKIFTFISCRSMHQALLEGFGLLVEKGNETRSLINLRP